MDEHAAPILGRDEERDRIERFLSRPRPAMLLVEGEAGIGKTTLWRHGVDRAGGLGFTVMAFRPGEAERSLTFAGLAGLLPDPLLDGALPEVPEPRRQALEVALLRRGGRPEGVDFRTVGLGLLSILELMAQKAPLLVAIDDIQWLDEPTGGTLDFALRRIGSADVAVLAARRTGRSAPGPSPLEPAFPEGSRERVIIGPMSVGALGRLVHDRLGLSLPRMVAGRLHQESGGNPFIALELARAAAARGMLPGPGEPFPLTGDAASLIGDRIARVSPEAREALLAISALAHPTTDMVAQAVGEDVLEGALEELVEADLVGVDGEAVRCTHPLIASAAYSRALPSRRRRLHGGLAAVVQDAEERARHLALAATGPDEAVAQALDEAATLARRRGASGAAAELVELAVHITSPADRAELARRQVVLSRCLLDAGSATRAREAVVRAVELLPWGPSRVDALIELARIESGYIGDIGAAGRYFRQALDEAGTDRAALARAHVWAGTDDQEDGSWGARSEHARAALDLMAGHEHEDPDSVASALVTLAEAGFRAGRGLDIGLLDRAVALEVGTRLPSILRPSVQRLGFLGQAGRHAESKRGVEACLKQFEEQGDWSDLPLLLRHLAYLGWCMGDLEEAWNRIRQAEEAAAEVGAGLGLIWAMGGRILAAMGRFEEARDWCRRGAANGKELGHWLWEMHGLASTGFLELTAGDPVAAADALVAAHAVSGRVPMRESGWDRTVGDLIEALIGAGRIHEADGLTTSLEAEVVSSGHPWTGVVSARCLGLLDATNARLGEAVACFDRSLSADPAGEMKFERARTLLAKGQVLRRTNQRRAAREALEEARTIFERCGSPPWAEKARVQQAGVSGRVAAPTELTGMERRAAELAATGRTNIEIAHDLFLSTRTVESHLSAAYRKLGVRSRTELAAALAGQAPTG